MTLVNMRINGVRSVAVSCHLCHHQAVLSADPWPDHVPVPLARCGESMGPYEGDSLVIGRKSWPSSTTRSGKRIGYYRGRKPSSKLIDSTLLMDEIFCSCQTPPLGTKHLMKRG
jgi:hypothetical protein